MGVVGAVAREEWRLWLRSKVIVATLLIVFAIISLASVSNTLRLSDQNETRQAQQAKAESTFLSQPDRHPHRMVHYGHYVFRTPPPLSIFDPGVDKVTGQSIFLEGHRQNSAMFADARASAQIASLQEISPAFVYQFLVPLLLIVLGHGVFVREREARTLSAILAQGTSGLALYTGKMLALTALCLVFLIPLSILVIVSMLNGEATATSLAVIGVYLAYLLLWSGLISFCSLCAPSRGLALASLIFIWILWSLVVPRFAVASASEFVTSPGKLETDFAMHIEMRELGDGHNAGDPAFTKLRANILAQYNVKTVEDLPINFRGLVAQTSEAQLKDVLDRYADQRMSQEKAQSTHLDRYGLLSPMIALSAASRRLAGTDLATHHRFLMEAEAVRFDFVQGLNKSHTEVLSYVDDINRNKGREAARRARISSDNWSVLDRFDFKPKPALDRLLSATQPFLLLCLWTLVLIGAGIAVSYRIKS